VSIKKIALLSTTSLSFVFICLVAFGVLTQASIPPQIEPLMSQDSRFPVRATDLALQSGYQDTFFGNNQRGRALIAADFDLDGRVDFYIGNPGDRSFVVRNSLTATGDYRFQPVQTLLDSNHLAWGAVTGDFDDDGDYDLFVTNGANEGIGHDYMFRNEYMETGELKFSDVTQAAGVAGPVPPGKDRPIRTPSGNARLADYDQDGDVDIFVSTNHLSAIDRLFRIFRFGDWSYSFREIIFADLPGRNTLWRNDGNFHFTDVTDEAGLGRLKSVTRHSTWLDYDNDSDMDLYENNMGGKNVLWKNQLMETGKATFEDVTEQLASPRENLAYPLYSFVSATSDVNNDGWEDIIAFYHHKPGSAKKENGPYEAGHAIFINNQGEGFTNIADSSGINVGIPVSAGVMGCQVGDISGDGIPDILFGNGDPTKGTQSQLFISDISGDKLNYSNASSIIDFPAEQKSGVDYPPYPYRTHGSAFVDVDNDGDLEIAMLNGGPALKPDMVREPNRLFHLDIARGDYFKVRLTGDGKHISRDAIGTRLALNVTDKQGESRTLYRTLHGSSCFSAHNSFTVHYYIGNSISIDSLTITWPNGRKQILTDGLQANSSLLVNYDHV
jgi:hypothetical protein